MVDYEHSMHGNGMCKLLRHYSTTERFRLSRSSDADKEVEIMALEDRGSMATAPRVSGCAAIDGDLLFGLLLAFACGGHAGSTKQQYQIVKVEGSRMIRNSLLLKWCPG